MIPVSLCIGFPSDLVGQQQVLIAGSIIMAASLVLLGSSRSYLVALLVRHHGRIGVAPHLIIEQSVEEATPKTMGPVEAHRRSVRYAREVFAKFAP